MDKRTDIRSTALEEVTEAAFHGVLAALERRQLPIHEFPGPILIGIIAWPELRKLEGVGERLEREAGQS